VTKPYPNDPFLTGYFAPIGVECDAPDLVVEGELPRDLAGTYYRNGPDPLHAPRPGDTPHWFDGDGMVHCFHIENGRVSWRNRWVRSRKYELERAAGKRLFGVFGNPMFSDPSVIGEEYNTANTHIVEHSGRLLALMEGAAATEIAPRTLETLGKFDFGGAIDGPVTAHPKFDFARGEMIFFGYQAQGPGSKALRYNVADRHLKVVRNELFDGPFASMVHDFFVTDTHAIFPIFPLTMSIERVMSGGPMLAWEPEKGTHFGVIPRNGTAADVKWFTMEARFMFHMMNAWTDGTKLHADVTASNATQFAPKPDGTMAKKSDGIAPTFRRWTIDLADNTGTIKETQLDDWACEFPRTDDRVGTKAYRHGYAVGTQSDELAAFSHLLHYDVQDGNRRRSWTPGKGYMLGEAVFAPRAGATAEGDGYLIVLGFNEGTQKSELFVLDADDVEKGPVAKAHLPLRIPAGFHGSWVAAT
jgi:carotenoid cleavage dioxygenase